MTMYWSRLVFSIGLVHMIAGGEGYGLPDIDNDGVIDSEIVMRKCRDQCQCHRYRW